MIRIRMTIVQHRHRLVVLAATLTLALALAWTHGAMAGDHMSGDHKAVPSIASICLATLELGGALTVLGGGVLLLGRGRARGRRADRRRQFSVYVTRPTRVRAQPRAGPAMLQVFRL